MTTLGASLGAVTRNNGGAVASRASSVVIGGSELTDLYITSAGESWPSDLAPTGYDFDAPNIGGSLYRLHLEGIQGRPTYEAKFD